MHVVWFKRDLRLSDHGAFFQALSENSYVPILPLYIVEPEYWALPDTSDRQWCFVRECLIDLRASLRAKGSDLVIRVGGAVEVFADLHACSRFSGLYSHEETGNNWTYLRDKSVARWMRDKGVLWRQIPQFGVARGSHKRDGWAANWNSMMGLKKIPEPEILPPIPKKIDAETIPLSQDLALSNDPCPHRQKGGRQTGLALQESFLTYRGKTYRSDMSSPLGGEKHCSRLSPYLAYGAISMREAAQAAWSAQIKVKLSDSARSSWSGSLKSYLARLHWHCHFIQKLEDQPDLEYQNLHPAYDHLRTVADPLRLTAWAEGQTGLPFLDACMRYLKATGWLNFRMRAMVTAVASYHFWLPWQQTGLILARRFVDYEPGIHWSQIQMQSGTTGINTPRIYNPVKQGQDQDPANTFVRRWVPELVKAGVPSQHSQKPWCWQGAGALYRLGYPEPIIDISQAARHARDQIWAVRQNSAFRQKARDIVDRHGSRKRKIPKSGKNKRLDIKQENTKPAQLSLFDTF